MKTVFNACFLGIMCALFFASQWAVGQNRSMSAVVSTCGLVEKKIFDDSWTQHSQWWLHSASVTYRLGGDTSSLASRVTGERVCVHGSIYRDFLKNKILKISSVQTY